MKLLGKTLKAGLVITLAVTLGATASFAQKKKAKCKDGETDQIAKYKLSKGENLDQAINASLTGKAGDPKKGLKWMTHRRLGNCIACHAVSKIAALGKPEDLSSQKKYSFHGAVGPTLDGVADRYSEGELRLIIVDIKKALPDANSIMPSFHRADGFTRVHKDCVGHVVLSAERVEDVVAYLKTLK